MRRSAAFPELIERHDRALRALAFRLLGDRDRMDDVLQEAYVRAYRALPRFRGRSLPGTWLYRIVYNACIDELRRERPDRRLPLAAVREAPADASGRPRRRRGGRGSGDRRRTCGASAHARGARSARAVARGSGARAGADDQWTDRQPLPRRADGAGAGVERRLRAD